MQPGLVSITFRKLTPEEIIPLVAEAGLSAIEWGADVHVRPGELMRASEINRMTREAGLRVAAYGSYYRLGLEPGDEHYQPFSQVLDTAASLQAPCIRIWAGTKASGDPAADDDYRQRIAAEARECARLAAMEHIRVALEWHACALTDATESGVRFLRDEINHPNCFTLWQPFNNRPMDESRAALEAVLPWLLNVHVFHWTGPDNERRPLEEGAANWADYFRVVRLKAEGVKEMVARRGQAEVSNAKEMPSVTDESGFYQRYALLEFVRDQDPEQFKRDAETLKNWLSE